MAGSAGRRVDNVLREHIVNKIARMILFGSSGPAKRGSRRAGRTCPRSRGIPGGAPGGAAPLRHWGAACLRTARGGPAGPQGPTSLGPAPPGAPFPRFRGTRKTGKGGPGSPKSEVAGRRSVGYAGCLTSESDTHMSGGQRRRPMAFASSSSRPIGGVAASLC